MKTPGFLLLIFLLLLGALRVSQAADVEAWLDRNRIAEGDTVHLTLEAQGQVSARPDTAPLEHDFDILGMSTGSRISIVNGKSEARSSWTLALSPKRSGKLRIPALSVAGATSPALSLEVSNAPAPSAADGADVFLETTLDPSEPYVQQQLIYTLRLFHAVPINSGQLSEPKPANTLVQRLGDDREYAVTRKGRRYRVLERRYALFPQASGRLELAAPVFVGEVPDAGRGGGSPLQDLFGNDTFFGRAPFAGLMAPSRRLRVRGQATGVDVRARPGTVSGGHWLPAQNLSLRGNWQPDGSKSTVGEPITLLLEVDAVGLTGGQLPDLAPQSVDGFSVYPDQAQRKTDTTETGVTGHLQQKIAFIAQRAGDLRLPAIDVSWWDTQADKARVAHLPGRIVQVSPSSAQATPVGPAAAGRAGAPLPGPITAQSDQPKPSALPPSASPWSGRWPWISALLAGGWLLTLAFVAWRALRHRRPRSQAVAAADKPRAGGAARKAFFSACREGDAAGARSALLDWAAVHWPQDPPRGLQALARRLPDPRAQAAVADLDRALYKGVGGWDGTHLAACLQRLPAPERSANARRATLAPLYPEAPRGSLDGT